MLSEEVPMGTTMAPAPPNSTIAGQPGQGLQSGMDRRRRRRAKISAQVHVRAVNSPEPFEEICMSVDVSRDGLLFTSKFAGYWKGQLLDVTFPYSNMADGMNQGQPAEVVRLVPQPGGNHGIAVQFVSAKSDAKGDRKTSASRPAVAATQEAAANVRQSVVLAIEPDPRGAESMRNLLEPDGYTVIAVPSAQAALEILRTTVPSVFIAEVEAEDMSGHDLCVIIKQNERLAKVPVILMTRSAQPADYATSHQLGAVVCMAKPFKPERLQQVVRLVAPPPALRTTYCSRASGSVERVLA
jgi:CheY-like chemotaxis protein